MILSYWPPTAALALAAIRIRDAIMTPISLGSEERSIDLYVLRGSQITALLFLLDSQRENAQLAGAQYYDIVAKPDLASVFCLL